VNFNKTSIVVADAVAAFLLESCPVVVVDGVKWCEENLSFNYFNTNKSKGKVTFEKHQLGPLKAYFSNTLKVTVVAPPQIGKSFPAECYLACMIAHGNFSAFMAFQDEPTTRRVMNKTLVPLLKSVSPDLRQQLSKQGAISEAGLNIQGAEIFSHSLQVEFATSSVRCVYASEMDRVQNVTREKRQIIYDTMYPRVSNYKDDGAKLIQESSPSDVDNITWQEYLDGTQSEFYLMCQNCEELTINSNIIQGHFEKGEYVGGLHWDKDEEGHLIRDSIRLQCPACLYKHKESEWLAMRDQGDDVHRYPERMADHISLQYGCLVGCRTKSWLGVVQKYIRMKKEKTLAAQIGFDTLERGLPHQRRKKGSNDRQTITILKHRASKNDPVELSPDNIANVFITADTQGKHYVYGVCALDTSFNRHYLKIDRCDVDGKQIEEAWRKKWFGVLPEMALIDRGGHRQADVTKLCRNNPAMYAYIGRPNAKVLGYKDEEDRELYPHGKYWGWSDNIDRVILADPKPYHQELLYSLYEKDMRDGYANIILPADFEADSWQVTEITNMKPPALKKVNGVVMEYDWKGVKGGFSEWRDHGKVDDVFDVMKMMEVCIDVAKKSTEADWNIELDWSIG